VERFRQQPPLPRGEREESNANDIGISDFWWLRQSHPSSFNVSNSDHNSSTDMYVSSTPPKSTSRFSKKQVYIKILCDKYSF